MCRLLGQGRSRSLGKAEYSSSLAVYANPATEKTQTMLAMEKEAKGTLVG